MNKKIYLKITVAAVMAALSIVLEKLSIPLGDGTYKITLYGFPLMFSSIFFGPVVGVLSGLVVGFISQLTSMWGLSPTSILWMLAPILWGTIGGLIIKLCKDKENIYNLKNIIIIVVVTSLSVSLVNSLVTYLDGLIMGYQVEQTYFNIIIRCLISLCLCVPYSIILYYLSNRLKHLSWQGKGII